MPSNTGRGSGTGRGTGRGRGRGTGRGRGLGTGRGRGRGTGRGTGHGRGRGKGRGTGRGTVAKEKERIQTLEQNCKENCKKKIRALNKKDLVSLMERLCEHQPGLIFDILETSKKSGPAPPGPAPPDPEASPQWCKCGRCRPMPTAVERLCCGCLPQNCHSTLPEMDLLVLNPRVLELANNYRAEVFARQNDHSFRAKRHAAYRQYVLWKHGYLGAGNRKVVPSCVVWRIRSVFPDPLGHYTGFRMHRYA